MESKGRRVVRSAGAVAAPVETPIEPPNWADSPSPAAEPVQPAMQVQAPASPVPESTGALMPTNGISSREISDFGRQTFAAFGQSQAALARGLEALSAEAAGLVLSGIDATARAASKMLGVKTFSDAIEVNAGLTCSSFDTLLGGSARLSELGMKIAAEISQPLLTELGQVWIKAARRSS